MITRPANISDATPMEFEIQVSGGLRNVAVSPNGKMLAWRDDAQLGLWVRPIDSVNAKMIEQSNPTSMSWSPDSRFLVYRSAGALKKFEVATASTQVVVPAADLAPNGGTAWTTDGYILWGSARGPLRKVRATGGNTMPALELDQKGGERGHRLPVVLPGGEHVLYLSLRPGANAIYVARLDGKGSRRRVYRAPEFAYVSPNTLLVMEDDGRLKAMPFDPESDEVGEPVLVSAQESTSFSASLDGRVLALVSGSNLPEELVLYDRSGKKLETITGAVPNLNAHLEFSPDGRRLLLERNTGQNVDLWTVELGRKVVSRLTFHEGNELGVWSADGQKVYFYAARPESGGGIFEIPANGTGAEKLIHKTQTHHMHASPDGKFLMFERTSSGIGLDILDLQNANKPSVYLSQAAGSPQFSPDSRFIVYESGETGRREVYVQTFPAGAGKWQISTNGGIEPRWRGDGKELFYDRGDGTVMAASLETRNGSLEVTSTKELFRFRRGRTSGTAIAVTPDGKIFAIRETPAGAEASITLKLNWKLPGR